MHDHPYVEGLGTDHLFFIFDYFDRIWVTGQGFKLGCHLSKWTVQLEGGLKRQ